MGGADFSQDGVLVLVQDSPPSTLNLWGRLGLDPRGGHSEERVTGSLKLRASFAWVTFSSPSSWA